MLSEDEQFYESLYKLDSDVVFRCNVISNSVETVTIEVNFTTSYFNYYKSGVQLEIDHI